MKSRKTHDDALGVTGADTVIGAGVIVTGDIISESDILIDGQLDGTIKAAGDVTIGVNANIRANVTSVNATVAGKLKGNVHASGEVTIRETGNIEGDIKAGGLAINSGGIFIGRSLLDTPHRVTPPERPTDPLNASSPKRPDSNQE